MYISSLEHIGNIKYIAYIGYTAVFMFFYLFLLFQSFIFILLHTYEYVIVFKAIIYDAASAIVVY